MFFFPPTTCLLVEGVSLPETAKVKLSTDEDLKAESMVSLDDVTLKPGQAILLQFPFKG